MKITSKMIILIAGLFTFSSFIGSQAIGKQIEGFWYSKEVKNSVIQIIKEDKKDVWFARIIKSDAPDYVGKILFRECTYQDKDKSFATIVTSPSMNADINATITISNNNMTIVGKKLFFTKTFYWVRIK